MLHSERPRPGLVRPLASLALAVAAFIGSGTASVAQGVPPIRFSDFPHLAIISPLFYWDGKPDAVHSISATCPNGRPIAGGLSIEKGNASLRIRESYPDGSSWVVRAVNRANHNGSPAPPLQVRAYAVCLLPVARGGSVQITQYPRLLHLSQRFSLPPGDVTTAERQACAKDSLVVSGGFGIDPEFKGPAFVRMELSYPDKWGWNVRALNAGEQDRSAAGVRVYAVCLGSDGGMSIQNGRGVLFAETLVTVKPGDGAVRQGIACRDAGSRAVGGGVRVLRGRSASIEVQESYPDAPGSWVISVTNRSPPGAGEATVRLYAICIGS